MTMLVASASTDVTPRRVIIFFVLYVSSKVVGTMKRFEKVTLDLFKAGRKSM
jgi:hypothetical protein